MYCGNCGKKIEDGGSFCPECGAMITPEQKTGPQIDSKKLGRYLKIGVIVAAVVLIAAIGFKGFSYIKSIPSAEEIQTTANNLQNGALVASDGTWLYYIDHGLCKMRLKDGSKQTVISSEVNVDHMFYLGDSLYYFDSFSYYKLTGNSAVEEKLGFSVFTNKCLQTDGKRYYVTGSSNFEESGIYSTKLNDTKSGTRISDIHPTRIFLYDDYLYVVSGYNSINNLPNENYGVWRMDKNGKNLLYLFDYCPNYLVFSGDSIYYTNQDNVICSANLDGSSENVYNGVVAGSGLNVSDKYIFYLSQETGTIYRMDKDGNNITELNKDRSSYINIIEDWIFYENRDYGDEIYKMSFDGSYNQPIY